MIFYYHFDVCCTCREIIFFITNTVICVFPFCLHCCGLITFINWSNYDHIFLLNHWTYFYNSYVITTLVRNILHPCYFMVDFECQFFLYGGSYFLTSPHNTFSLHDWNCGASGILFVCLFLPLFRECQNISLSLSLLNSKVVICVFMVNAGVLGEGRWKREIGISLCG